MTIKQFYLDQRSGDVTFEMTNGNTESFNLSVANNMMDNGVNYIQSLLDLPTPTEGMITLGKGAYCFVGDVDLEGARLVFTNDAVIFGTSSETSSITSTGLTGNPLITSSHDLPMRNIEIRDLEQGFNLTTEDNTKALDWTAVNFVNVDYIGIVSGYSNFIQTFSAYFDSGKITFSGTVGTVGFDSTLFSLPIGKAIEFAEDFVSTRRIRFIFCPFVITSGNTGIDLPLTATVPVDSYNLLECNFSGGGTYLTGVNQTSDIARFKGNKGIINTAVNGQMYLTNNVSTTTIANTTDFFKAQGTTIASADNQKYLHSSNRLTNNSVISRKFLIQVSLSFSAGNNNVCEFGIFDSELNQVRTPSRTKSTANASGRAENITFFCVVEHSQNDYIEVHVRNTSSTSSITVTDMNTLITEIN